MADKSAYQGREQTLVKHIILRQYVSAWAHKVGTWCDTLTYVDCFSGPWNAVSDDLSDSSFSIAIEELRKARETHARAGRQVRLRCLFIEKDPGAYAKLKAFCDDLSDVTVVTIPGEFEDHVAEVITFIKAGGSKSFPFVFIDPTGWTGFAMDTIQPLLLLRPIEVLINFMTSHIRRFIESSQEETRESFTRMFGSADFLDRISGKTLVDKEDALIDEYFRNLKSRGDFQHVAAAIVLDPDISRTAFHLIYATRHPAGLHVFKGVEKSAMTTMETARTEKAQQKHEAETHQEELFGPIRLTEPTHYETLRERYTSRARSSVDKLLSESESLPYDDAWRAALTFPLVWESDLKEWIANWQRDGVLVVQGLGPNDRVPKINQGHTLTLVPPDQRNPVPKSPKPNSKKKKV